jgi:hypothetical protein
MRFEFEKIAYYNYGSNDQNEKKIDKWAKNKNYK